MPVSEVLKLWEFPSSYCGATWYDYYVVIGQHRDSDKVSRSNFTVAHKMLSNAFDRLAPSLPELPNDDQYLINPYESHWAVGHVEWIGLHKNSPQELIDVAENIINRIADYPILDESHYSELEWKEASEYWAQSSIRERVRDWIKPAGLPCFAARHDLCTIMQTYDSKADRLWESITAD